MFQTYIASNFAARVGSSLPAFGRRYGANMSDLSGAQASTEAKEWPKRVTEWVIDIVGAQLGFRQNSWQYLIDGHLAARDMSRIWH